MESGAGPAEEIGYTFGNALMILDALRPRLAREAFEQTVRRISFFINSGIELVPEISKVRAYFKLWRELCRDEYGIDDVAFRAGCQVRSLTLTEQQPELNIIRIAYEALPVVISAAARVNALQLPGFREAMALPDQAEQALEPAHAANPDARDRAGRVGGHLRGQQGDRGADRRNCRTRARDRARAARRRATRVRSLSSAAN